MVDRIEIGATPDDGSGDSLRIAFEKVNANFAELSEAFARLAAATPANSGAARSWPGEWVARHVSDRAPDGAPPLLGAIWVDVSERRIWISVGTGSEKDWIRIADAGKAD